MLQSMTGYGKSSQTVGTKKITVEIKSLNSKQMDLSTRVPSLFREKDIDEIGSSHGTTRMTGICLFYHRNGKHADVVCRTIH